MNSDPECAPCPTCQAPTKFILTAPKIGSPEGFEVFFQCTKCERIVVETRDQADLPKNVSPE